MRLLGTVSRKTTKARRRKSTKGAKSSGALTAASRGHPPVGDLEQQLARQARELEEAREERAAIAEVLRVVSSSPGELEPVFEAMLANATRICEAELGMLWRAEDNGFRPVALRGLPPELAGMRQPDQVFHFKPETPIGRLAQTKQLVHIADACREPAYIKGLQPLKEFVDAFGARTNLLVPMLKDNALVGIIGIWRKEVRPFADRQIALVQNFADQAVIAIENARLLNELRESLQQQTATSEVLQVISSSPGELEPVFNAMLENATRICEAKLGNLFLREGNCFRAVAVHGESYYADRYRRDPIADISQNPGTPLDRIIKRKKVIHIPDLRLDQSYLDGNRFIVALADTAGARTELVVPMLKEDELVGAIVIYRQVVRPFTEKQIALVQNFAAQAVIAIENTRLLNELRQRTNDLTAALEQQTATSEVLRVISSSPGELEPVFQTMLDNATRICEAEFGSMQLRDGDAYRRVAVHNAPPKFMEFSNNAPVLKRGTASSVDRAIDTAEVVHILDVAAENPNEPIAKFGGARTLLVVPMLKESEPIGVFGIYRQEVRPFTDKQIALVQNFAAQAVVAIENARLLNELHQRTDDLTESLQQQTATSEILDVISNSPTDSQPAFDAIVRSGLRLFPDAAIMIGLLDGDVVRAVAIADPDPAGAEALRARMPIPLSREFITSTAILDRREIDLSDVREAPEELAAGARNFLASGYRAQTVVPMMRGEEAIGTVNLVRRRPGPLSDKQRELLRIFANQAVIAIENTRLFNELRQSLQQQTATADVLKTISRSTFDLQTVLDTLVQSAARLCDAESASIHRPQGNSYPYVASYGLSRDYDEYMRSHPLVPGRGTVLGRAVTERKPIQVNDVEADPEYTLREGQKLAGFRTVVGIPLLREGVPIGVIMLTRNTVRPFTDKQIELATTFADQAAIAIENVRLFDEIQDKSRQLEVASQHKSQFLANMSHELRTPLNAILGYTELMADGAYGEPSEKMLGILKRLEANGKHLLGLINDVLDLSKIEAGQLVLELSEYSVQDIVQTVRSTLEPLAADKKLAFKVEVAPQLPSGRGDGRRLTQVLINLVGNAIKFTDGGDVAIKAEANNGAFYVSVRDTGPGISAADQAKLFQEFQQADNAITRKKGGTGLGLAISKRIIEMHGGKIWVESQVGQGSTFAFKLPVVVERQVEPPA